MFAQQTLNLTRFPRTISSGDVCLSLCSCTCQNKVNLTNSFSFVCVPWANALST